MKLDYNQQAFFALVRAGLREKDVRLLRYGTLDFNEVYRFASEQSLVGLIAAGIEHVTDVKIPQSIALMFVGDTLQLEQRNKAMNEFIAKLVERLKKEYILTLLVKGQGIAQCYERPLWRTSGDVDLLLDEVNYQKAAKLLLTFASNVEEEDKVVRHLAMNIGEFEVELHGTLCGQIRKSVDNGLIEVQEDTFENQRFRIWHNNNTDVLLPCANNDVVFVFAHIYQHFFGEGIGLRQICDWCRLLWTYKDEIDKPLLESRLKSMHLMDKWQAFAALAVEYLGMPVDAMPFYSTSTKWKKKADGIIALILESGNFGHAVDKSYKHKYPTIIRAIVAASHHTSVAFRHFLIFPIDSFLGWIRLVYLGGKANIRK
jgi:hypothetical protein